MVASLYLAILFFTIAAIYASVGFGGGSTYIAILALAGFSFEAIPIIALLCNIIVVTGGSLRFQYQNLIPWKRIWLLLLLSFPAAWLGGQTPISREYFMTILGATLILAALIILWRLYSDQKAYIGFKTQLSLSKNIFVPSILGVAIGYISGLVGIGGGIFLAPLLLLMKWGNAREVAATASIFILFNSIAGLAGQFVKYEGAVFNELVIPNLSLFIAVLIGGQLGSYMAVKILPEYIIGLLTALLTLYVGLRILWFN